METEQEIGDVLRARGLTLATAESCTGGLLGHRITSISGSSAYYLGGFITYSYEAKEMLLGVRHETLVAHGAVSKETAQEMARGARLRLGADVALSVTGIAGPTGATPDKPVGLVYVALSATDAEQWERHLWHGDRLENNQLSARAALALLRAYLFERESRSAASPVPSSQFSQEKSMLEFIQEAVTTEMQRRPDGSERPLAFHWRGQRYQIESWGRESTDTRPGRALQCYLVQTPGPETWELCRDTETAQWTLTRHWAGQPPVV